MKVDYLVVGAGLYGASFSRIMADAGKTCVLIDRRNHIAGNCYTESVEGVNVHVYGPHIFHTSSSVVWDFVQQFATFNNYRHDNVMAIGSDNEVYSLPFTMHTFSKLFNTALPSSALNAIERERFKGVPTNLEEQALSLVGKRVYETLIKGYTYKQWGRDPKDLPAFIINRLPLRFTYDSNYFNDTHQGIPIGGYTNMVSNMISGIECWLDAEYKYAIKHVKPNKIVFTGPIDEYFDYRYGKLDYRSVRFDTEVLPTDNYQGVSQFNDCRVDVPYTRTIEHRWFEQSSSLNTVISREYSQEYVAGAEPCYPVNDDKNQAVFRKYWADAEQTKNTIFGGRLAEYKYMDMHVVIASAIKRAKQELEA